MYQTGVGQLQVLDFRLQLSLTVSVRISNKLSLPLVSSLNQEIWSSIKSWTLILFFQSVFILLKKKNSVLFTEFKHHRQNRQDLHVTFCHTDIYAFKSLLNLSVSFFNYAGKWGMAFINCLTHDFLLWQESEPISKYWVFQLCLIINVKLFHMFCTKNKKQL